MYSCNPVLVAVISILQPKNFFLTKQNKVYSTQNSTTVIFIDSGKDSMTRPLTTKGNSLVI